MWADACIGDVVFMTIAPEWNSIVVSVRVTASGRRLGIALWHRGSPVNSR